jgi:hypothetical protein
MNEFIFIDNEIDNEYDSFQGCMAKALGAIPSRGNARCPVDSIFGRSKSGFKTVNYFENYRFSGIKHVFYLWPLLQTGKHRMKVST